MDGMGLDRLWVGFAVNLVGNCYAIRRDVRGPEIKHNRFDCISEFIDL